MEIEIPQQLLRHYARVHILSANSFSGLLNGYRCIIVSCQASKVSERYIEAFSGLIRRNIFAVQQLKRLYSKNPLLFVIIPAALSRLSDCDIQNDLIARILLSLLEMLCAMQEVRFPHGALRAENIFIDQQAKLLLGPPLPFFELETMNSDYKSEFSAVQDAKDVGTLVLKLISGKVAFENSIIAYAAQMLVYGVAPGLVIERVSYHQSAYPCLESPEYNKIIHRLAKQVQSDAVQAHDTEKARKIVSIDHILPSDLFERKIERLRSEADKITCKYERLAIDTGVDSIYKQLRHYACTFPDGIRRKEENLSFSSIHSPEYSVLGLEKNSPTIQILKVSIFTTEPKTLDFAAQWHQFEGKTARFRIQKTGGVVLDLGRRGITLHLATVDLPSRGSTQDSDDILIILCCRGESSKQFFSFSLPNISGDRWIVSKCKASSLLVSVY